MRTSVADRAAPAGEVLGRESARARRAPAPDCRHGGRGWRAQSVKPGVEATKRVVVTGIPSDSHTWNLVFLQLLLEEHGCVVTNLGSCVPIQLVVDTCRDERPDALIVSTVNGHGHIEGRELLEAIRRHEELSWMTAVIGGKLGTLGPQNRQFEHGLLEAGYDAVFHEDATPQALIGVLAQARAPQLGR